nr:serine/arginine repetitive matrix protein 1-like isoform X1 [Penaeus vannamei]
MARLTCCLLLVWASVGAAMPNAGQRGVPLAAGVPEARQNTLAERFAHGFAGDFAKNLPTSEFLGSFSGRQKRQVAVTSAIEGILSTHYGGEPATPHLQALLTRNSLARPARQSPSSPSSPSFSASSSPSSPPPSSDRPPAPVRSNFQSPPRSSFSAPLSSSSSPSSFRPVNRPPSSRPDRQQAPRPQQASFRPSPPARSQFSPPRRESFAPPRPFPTFQEASSRTTPENPFPSSTFAGQQFETLFTGFDSFESARLPRQKRDVTARQDVSSQLSGILTSPWEGSVPSSISSLLNRNNRFPRNPNVDSKPPSSSSPVVEQPNRQAQSSPASFSLPFRIPNFFEVLGMRRRSLDVAQERQGIADTLEGFLTSPYQGSIPTSIDSLFRSNKNRFVRKTQPQPVAHPRPSPVASDDPSQAAVRLFPNNANTGFHVNVPSGHFRFQHHSRRKRDLEDASEDLQQSASGRRFRLRPRPGPPRRSPHNRGRASRQSKRPHHFKKPEAERPNFNEFDDEIIYDSSDELLDFSEFEGFPSANFLDNFNAPFPSEDFESEELPFEASGVREQVRPALKKPSNRPTRLSRPLPRRPPPRRPSSSGRQRSPVGRPSPLEPSPGLRPGPSPRPHPPPSNSVRAPRHILLRNRLMPKLTRQQDIPIVRRSLQVAQRRQSDQSVTSDVAEAREDSAGFIVGKPDNFPLFSAIGGFGPMQDIEKGDSASSFVPAFSIPTMNIPDIPDQHPQFEFPQFAQQSRAPPASLPPGGRRARRPGPVRRPAQARAPGGRGGPASPQPKPPRVQGHPRQRADALRAALPLRVLPDVRVPRIPLREDHSGEHSREPRRPQLLSRPPVPAEQRGR